MGFKFSTKAIHSGFHYDPHNGAVMPPISLASTFAQKSPGEPIGEYEYARSANPTRDVLEANLASLENANHALTFSSGCAALTTVLHTLNPGDHIILSDDVYGGTLRLFEQVFKKWGLSYTQCDMTKIEELEQAYTPQTRLVWLETPSNPLLKIIDIAAVAKLNASQSQGALLGVDNTFATPFLQTPLDSGADIILHSTTKYLGGHSDLVGGALMVNDKTLFENLTFFQNALGAVPSPFDCYLLFRSLKTLGVRMQAHCEHAKKIANFLSSHQKVESVIYPGLPSHPQHALAKAQMRDMGGMISVELKGDTHSTTEFLKKLKIFTLAESLGGVESLIEHPGIMTHATIPPEHREKIGIKDTLVRISVGLEDVDDLIADLEQAL